MSTVRLCWIDWLTDATPHFDVQEMIEFCGSHLAGSWTIEIRNAIGRLGQEQASEQDAAARVATVTFCFEQNADWRRFKTAFATEVAQGSRKAPGFVAADDGDK